LPFSALRTQPATGNSPQPKKELKMIRQPFLFNGMADTAKCRVEAEGSNSLIFYSPYHPTMVAQLKNLIPFADRKWDHDKKAWLIAAGNEKVLIDLAWAYFKEDLYIPSTKDSVIPTVWEVIEVRYLGQTKERDSGERTAFAYVDREWKVIFPESVLKDWFQVLPDIPGGDSSLYAVLGIRKAATLEELKTAFRRLARQWHPDVCKESNAHEVFQRINHAYQTLSDENKRARYDAGLMLSASLDAQYLREPPGYRAPLRCGMIFCEGEYVLGRFVVSKIFDWVDITDSEGRVLVTSWIMGDKEPVERWV